MKIKLCRHCYEPVSDCLCDFPEDVHAADFKKETEHGSYSED